MILFSSEWYIDQIANFLKKQQEQEEQELEVELLQRQDKNIHVI